MKRAVEFTGPEPLLLQFNHAICDFRHRHFRVLETVGTSTGVTVQIFNALANIIFAFCDHATAGENGCDAAAVVVSTCDAEKLVAASAVSHIDFVLCFWRGDVLCLSHLGLWSNVSVIYHESTRCFGAVDGRDFSCPCGCGLKKNSRLWGFQLRLGG